MEIFITLNNYDFILRIVKAINKRLFSLFKKPLLKKMLITVKKSHPSYHKLTTFR